MIGRLLLAASLLMISGTAYGQVSEADNRTIQKCYRTCSAHYHPCPSGKTCALPAFSPNCADPGERRDWDGYCERQAAHRKCGSDCAAKAKELFRREGERRAHKEQQERQALQAALDASRRQIVEWARLERERLDQRSPAGKTVDFWSRGPSCVWWQNFADCETKCQQGSAVDCTLVADLLFSGNADFGIRKDRAAAARYAQQACTIGDPLGCYEAYQVGRPHPTLTHKDGTPFYEGAPEYVSKAMALGEKLCDEQKVGRGCFAAAQAHEYNHQNDRLFTYLKKGCEHGSVEACQMLWPVRRNLRLTMDQGHFARLTLVAGEQSCRASIAHCPSYAWLLEGTDSDIRDHVAPNPTKAREIHQRLCSSGYRPSCNRQ